MTDAFTHVITENKIAMTAGETAVLGKSREATLLVNAITMTKERISGILNAKNIATRLFRLLFSNIYNDISTELTKQTKNVEDNL
jgi:hypothetical protein